MSNTAPFLHIAYANNNTGTLDFTTTGGIERTYTGFYTDEYATDSNDPTKYKWLTNSEFKNKVNTGAYANSADGTDGFTTVYPNLNILTNSYDFSKGYTFNQAGTVWEVLEPDNTPTKIIKLDYVASAWNGFYQTPTSGNWKTVPDVGDTVTLSFYARGGGGRLYSTIEGITDSINTLTTEDWKLYTLSGIATKKVLNIAIYYHNSSVDKTPIYIHSVKFEKGSTATPWMPSSSEVKDSDYPKYIGLSNVTNPTTFKDYEWTLLESIPETVASMPTVKSINVTYGIGTLTTKPMTWLSAKPKLDVNQVLWYKSEITGTDDSVGVYYSNLVGGANLDDGDSPLDNTEVSIVLNDKIVNIPHDLALKLDLLAQVSDKRDNELAQSIADTNNRISNIDMITGLEGLEKERTERKAGDEALQTQITTNLGTETDHFNQLTERLVQNEAKSGRSIIQGTAYVGSNEPSIFLDHVNAKAYLRYQIPGDITYQVKELEFDYQNLIEFRDEISLTVWSKEMSSKYGGFPWRDTILTNSDTDILYLTGINSVFLLDGSLLIRGAVYFSDGSEAIGSMVNRGFLPKYANIVVAPDAKSVKSIRLIGKMGRIRESFSIEGTASWTVERVDNVVTITNSPKLGTNTTTTGDWLNLSQKAPHGLRPMTTKEICCGVLATNNLFMVSVASNGSLRYHQASSNANKFILAGGASWTTLDEYLPTAWQSNTKWTAR